VETHNLYHRRLDSLRSWTILAPASHRLVIVDTEQGCLCRNAIRLAWVDELETYLSRIGAYGCSASDATGDILSGRIVI